MCDTAGIIYFYVKVEEKKKKKKINPVAAQSMTNLVINLVSRGSSVQFSSVQSLSHVLLFVTPWTAAHQASLCITNSRSLLRLMSNMSVMPSNHIILCRLLFLAFNLSWHQGLFP